MTRRRRPALAIALVAIAVIVLLAVGYAVRDRYASGRVAGAADSTAAGDTTAAATAGAGGASSAKVGGDGGKETPPVPVEVARVARRSISSYYVTTATLEPEKTVDILARTSNRVAQILVEEGDVVRKGQLLCRLDDDEQRVARDEAEINREQKKSDFKRIESMHRQNLVSEKEFLDSKYQYELAENAFEAASVKYEYTRVRAPFDGVVTQRLVDEGENVAVGARLFVMADVEPLRLTMYLPESEIKTIRRGQVVHVVPDANPDVEFAGRIVRLAPEVDERTGTVKVTAETRGGGIPGSFVRVRIVTDTRPSTLAVPRRGVVSDAGDHFVFVAEADTVRRVKIAVGYEDEEFAEVTAGLQEGDSVVVAGSGGVRTGTRIKIVARPEADSETAVDTVRNDRR